MIKLKLLFMICFLFVFRMYLFSVEIIAVDEGVVPLMYKARGEARGLYPFLITDIFNRINIPVSIRPLPWRRALAYADEGLMGVGGVYKTRDRLEKYDFSDELFQEVIVIYTLRENRFEYNNISDLYGKKIGIIRGWSYGEEFDKASLEELIKVEEVSTDEQNFLKLLNKRIDCLLTVKETGELVLENNPQFQGFIVPLNGILIVNPTYLIFPKILNKKELLNLFNEKLFELKESNEYKELIRRGMRN